MVVVAVAVEKREAQCRVEAAAGGRLKGPAVTRLFLPRAPPTPPFFSLLFFPATAALLMLQADKGAQQQTILPAVCPPPPTLSSHHHTTTPPLNNFNVPQIIYAILQVNC